jgi:predicted DsbA family dithiol-disulfide isomerase
LPYTPHERIPNSRAALNVAELARERGVHPQLHDRLMRAFWAEDQDISSPDVLAKLGAEAGLDPDEVRDVASNFPYQDRINASSAAVFDMGGNGVPAFVVDDRVLIPGAQPHEFFEMVMEKLGIDSVANTDDRADSAG